MFPTKVTPALNQRGFGVFEGHSQERIGKTNDLIDLVKAPVKRVLEIGFNAGHSAELVLETNPDAFLVSFDVGSHAYVPHAKEIIDELYPDRHVLVLGDSRLTIPEFVAQYPTARFDVIFIDGGHSYEVVRADLENCAALAHDQTIVIMDDTHAVNNTDPSGHTYGPTRAWTEFIAENRVKQVGCQHYDHACGMSWGHYLK